MAWQDKIEQEIVVITGDRREYRPKWMKPLFRIPYNVSSFNFPNQKGTLVKKFQQQGAKFPIEIYFDGADHIDETKQFIKSAEDTRHWHILHPLYGDLRLQPTELTFDNTNPNITKITGIMLETLANNFPNNAIDQGDQVALKKEETDIKIADAFAVSYPSPTGSDIVVLNQSLDIIVQDVSGLITTDEDSNNFINLVQAANRELVLDNFNANNAITAMQQVINYPATVAKSVNQRLTSYVTTLQRFDNTIRSVSNVPESLKVQFEAISATLLTAMALLVSTKDSDEDYSTGKEVLEVVDTVIIQYNDFITTLDFIQSPSAQELDSFIPNHNSNIGLNDTINFALANLFIIALNAKQERNIFLEEESNLILLTHRFLGLDVDDENLDEFIRNNNIGLNELLTIKKDRKITYFV